MRQRSLLAAYTLLGLASCGCLNGAPGTNKDTHVAAGPSLKTNPSATENEQQTRAQKPDSSGDQPQPQPTMTKDPNTIEEREYRARAVVGNVPILDEEVAFEMTHPGHPHFGPFKMRPTEHEALEAVINREVLMQHIEALLGKGPGQKFLDELHEKASEQFQATWVYRLMKLNNMTTEEEFKEFVRANKIPLDLLRRQFERDIILSNYLHSVDAPHLNTIDRRMIQEYYETHPEDFRVPDSVDWQGLFLYFDRKYANREAAHNHAQVVAQRIRDGEDFGTLVDQLDHGLHKATKGKGVGHHRGEIQPAQLEKDLFEMRENEVRVIPIPAGHYVVRLVKRVKAGRMPFNAEVQKEIKKKLEDKVRVNERKAAVAELRKKIAVIYLDAAENSAPAEKNRDRQRTPTGAR